MKSLKLKQTKHFKATLSSKFKQALKDDAKRFNTHYGVFFDTSGTVRVERINPNAQYMYVFRTDKD